MLYSVSLDYFSFISFFSIINSTVSWVFFSRVFPDQRVLLVLLKLSPLPRFLPQHTRSCISYNFLHSLSPPIPPYTGHLPFHPPPTVGVNSVEKWAAMFLCVWKVCHTHTRIHTHCSSANVCTANTYALTHTHARACLCTSVAVAAVLRSSAYRKCCRQRRRTIKSILKSAVVAWIIYLKRAHTTAHTHTHSHTHWQRHSRCAEVSSGRVGNMVA